MHDAADAIEALQAQLAGSKDAIRILKHNLEQMKEDRMKQIEKEMARLKREVQE
jgi:RNA binding exosome subunit